jgi:dTDP-4-dehydrorhamnose 3,5-epimerase
MAVSRFVRTELAVDGACTYTLIEESYPGGSSIELFHILKSHPTPDMPQITVSRSQRNVIRGLHCSPHHKMVCCPSGRAFDVVVDLRPTSPTFLKWTGAWLSRTTHIVIPAFCAHGFFAAEDDTSILYLQGGCFAPALDFSLRWDDPTVGVNWPAPIDADDYVISPKDRANPLASQELYDLIKERLEKPIESLRLGHYADFAIIADAPGPEIQGAIEAIQAAGKKWHFCHSNGTQRETLQEELYALKPLVGVIYFANDNTGDLNGNFTTILNVVAAADVKKFPLTIVIGREEFAGRGVILGLVTKNATNVKIVDGPADSAALVSLHLK